MLDKLEAGIGLDVVLWLQAHGNESFDFITQVLHRIGHPLIMSVILLIIFWRANRQLAIQLLLGVIFAATINTGLKHALDRPRPHLAYPDHVYALVEQSGPGLPSGHVLVAVVIVLLIGLWVRRYWFWVVGGAYVMLVAWARMYAGVHYPQDVVVSLLTGPVIVWLYLQLEQAWVQRGNRV